MPMVRQASCSDPLDSTGLDRWDEVRLYLGSLGHPCEPTDGGPMLWTAPWWLVADPTGGSQGLSNLPRLVEGLPSTPCDRENQRAWCSLSDNCLTLNLLLDRGLCRVLHGQLMALGGRDSAAQRARFKVWSAALLSGAPFPPEVLPRLVPLRGRWTDSVTLIGGNVGALERLGTTPWRPLPRGRILLVESLSMTAADAPQRVRRLVEDPWWRDIGGLVFGRFTAADREEPEWLDRCLGRLPDQLPVARLPQVGHGADAWTIPLGESLSLSLERSE